MSGLVAVHRANHAEIIGQSTEQGQGIADLEARLPAPGEGEGGTEGRGLAILTGHGNRLAIIARQFGLGVKEVDMARPAFQEHVDNAFDLGGKVGRPRITRLGRGALAGLATVGQDGRQGQAAEPSAAALPASRGD